MADIPYANVTILKRLVIGGEGGILVAANIKLDGTGTTIPATHFGLSRIESTMMMPTDDSTATKLVLTTDSGTSLTLDGAGDSDDDYVIWAIGF
jgi:hypothetical protein